MLFMTSPVANDIHRDVIINYCLQSCRIGFSNLSGGEHAVSAIRIYNNPLDLELVSCMEIERMKRPKQ